MLPSFPTSSKQNRLNFLAVETETASEDRNLPWNPNLSFVIPSVLDFHLFAHIASLSPTYT